MRPTIENIGRTTRGETLNEAEIRGFLAVEYPRLVNAVALACGSYPAAEDAVQEALVRAWVRSERGERLESLPGWVASVALNHTRSGWRRTLAERRARQRIGAAEEPEAAPNEDRVEVSRALAALPRRQREVAVLRYLLEMSTAEVGAALGIAEGTVKSSLSRAREHLAVSLQVHEVEVTNDADGR